MNRPAPQTSTDRPTATYPTDPAAIWADPAGYPTDWLADRTPTATYPAGYPQAAQAAQAPQAAPHVTTNAPQNEGPIQDMGRPGILARPSMRWHPSLMQLATAAVVALLAFISLQHLALDGIASARRAAIEQARATPAATAAPLQPDWVTEDTHAPYSKDDPTASPLDLPRCTTAQDTPLPCLASTFPQNSNENPTRVVVLEEDASLTALARR